MKFCTGGGGGLKLPGLTHAHAESPTYSASDSMAATSGPSRLRETRLWMSSTVSPFSSNMVLQKKRELGHELLLFSDEEMLPKAPVNMEEEKKFEGIFSMALKWHL